MVELREQLGALLGLELKYAPRDYLLDLASQNELCCSPMPQSENCDNADYRRTSRGQITPSCEGTEASTNALSKTGRGKDRNNSRTVSISSRSNVITEQQAVAWREKICEWSYQGEWKTVFISFV